MSLSARVQAAEQAAIPGLHGPLLLQRSKLLWIHRQGGRVDDFGLPVAVGELQGAVPFPVSFADDGVGWIVFHFCCDPVDFPTVEGLCVECHGGRVPGLGTTDADLPSKLHPWDGEDGAGVGTGQCEDIVFSMVQEPKHTSGREGESAQQEETETTKDRKRQSGDP